MNEAIQYWEVITAFVLPLIIATVTQKNWTSAAKSWTMFIVSAVVTIVQLFIRDELNDWTDPTAAVLKVTALTIAFYVGFWKQTGVAPKIEEATTVSPEAR